MAIDRRDPLRRLLRLHEGVRAKPYTDSLGILTIGVGRNLRDVGLRPAEIAFLLEGDITEARETASRLVPAFYTLGPARQAALLSMAFVLGPDRMRTFRRTLAAVADGDWAGAAQGLRASKWAQQAGGRVAELAEMLERDVWPPWMANTDWGLE